MATILTGPRTDIPQPVTSADVLNRAADLLEEFGWHQGAYGDVHCLPTAGGRFGDGASRFCALGAIRRATGDFGLNDDDSVEHARHLAALIPEADNFIARWNDEPGRTKAEVVERLREAARRASGAFPGGVS